MKKFLVTISAIIILCMTSASFAYDLLDEMPSAPQVVSLPRIYVYLGIEGGFGWTHWKLFGSNDQFKKDNGAVSRIFFGYEFSKYFSVEAGYSYFFNKAKFELSTSNYNEMQTQVIDLLGKLSVPANDDTSFYAKFGVDYLMTKISKTGSSTNLMASNTKKQFDISYGIGTDYAITSHTVINLEWLRHGGRIKIKDGNIQPYTDSFMVGLRYKFDI